MIGFCVKGLKLTFDFGFFMVLAFFSLFDPYGLAVYVLCACIIHESGHIIAAALCGVDIKAVHFHAGGIRMVTAGGITAFYRDMLILLSGPLFNIIAALLFYSAGSYVPFSVNLVIGCYNLLPFSRLDGGAILSEILERYGIFPPVVMKTAAAAAALLISLFFIFSERGSIILYITLIFLAVSEFCY